MTSISFVFRPSSKMGRHPGSIYLRVIQSRKTKTVTVASRIFPEEWDKENQTIIYPENSPHRIRHLEETDEKIRDITNILQTLIRKLEKQGFYTIDDIFTDYNYLRDSGHLLSFTELQAKKLEKAGQERTARAYRTVASGLVKFNKGKDIPLTHINASLIKAYESDLKEKGKMPNTISYHMRNLRAIYNKATAEKRIPVKREKPFREVYTGIKKTVKRALTIEDIHELHKLDIQKRLQTETPGSPEYKNLSGLQHAWKLFFFSFNARGMCFIDLAYLRKDNIQKGFIRYYRKKTGQLVEVRVTEEMQNIMDSFAGEVRTSEYIFPIIQAGKSARLQYETAMRIQNCRLKELAKMANVKSKVTTHVARHSWATIGKLKNLPIGVISEALGHSSQKITYAYLASFDRSILDDANDLIITAIKEPYEAVNQ